MSKFLFSIPVVAACGFASAAMAQDNTVYLLQDNRAAESQGNVLTIDQSGASNALLAGDELGTAPAIQVGDDNSAEITAEGENVSVLFAQGAPNNPAFGNSATIGLDGTNLVASLEQLGEGNQGSVFVTGLNNSGTLLQDGIGNEGTLSVDGVSNTGTLIQTGNRNVMNLAVDGTNTNVTYEIVGSDFQPVNSGPVVFSNAGTVSITQTGPTR
ncbi:hypothetical protein [Pseudoponticoccus marisrubri]|uniref:Curlin n=1 Tax=Pseudoponticoccus marisrubri TaxID=1685382 RepID=A0A0W7WLK7_9RHOB|nr:hypothetical protein [Pseudoponticoccus marisrubri]KUF11470.1 hypothetical protein AVJ23_06810 [Pseudoponticoccus marisrubri]